MSNEEFDLKEAYFADLKNAVDDYIVNRFMDVDNKTKYQLIQEAVELISKVNYLLAKLEGKL